MTRRGLILFFLFYNRGQNNFRNNIAKKIQSPEVGGEIKSVSRIKLSFDGNQVPFWKTGITGIKGRTDTKVIQLVTTLSRWFS